MSDDRERLVIRGEIHVRLSAVARCYEVELTFVEEAYQLGLLGPGELVEPVEGGVAIAATQLDRVARIVRLHFQLGVSLPGVWMLLEPNES